MADSVNDESFDISIEGEYSGERWIGTFRAKVRLSHRDRLRADQIRRELAGSQAGSQSERTGFTTLILSELAVRLTKAPEWWKSQGDGLDLEDDNVIVEVYNQALEIEKKAHEAKKKRAEEALAAMRKQVEEEDRAAKAVAEQK